MFKKRLTEIGLAMFLTLSAGAAQAVNVAVNGGFETGDFTGWTQFPSGTQTVGSFAPTEGAFAANLFNNNPASASLIKNANVGVGVVAPNSAFTVTFDARGSTAVGGVAFAEFFSELSGGGTSASEILGGGPLALNADPAVWTSFSFSGTTGPDVSGGVTLQLTATTGGATGSLADIFYDNIVIDVTAVPIPAAVWLFGSGLVGLVGVARRKRKAA
jgi:hypothetical protein